MHRRSLATFLSVAAFAGCSLAIDTSGLSGGSLPEDGGPQSGEASVDDGGAATTHDAEVGAEASTPCVIDVTGDPKNCGRCGHDCLGGECAASQCQPTTVIRGEPQILGVTLDATNLYWSRFDGMVRSSKLDGTQKRDVRKLNTVGHIEVDEAFVYVPGMEGNDVSRFRKDGVGDLELLASCEGTCLGIALKSGRVYFTERGNDSVGRLRIVESDGGSTVLLSDLDFPEDVFAASKSLLVSNEAANNVVEVPEGTTKSSILAAVPDPVAVVADATDLYIVSQNTKTIRRRALAGGTVTVIANLPSQATGLAQDAVSLYWAQDDGTISRLAK